MCGEWSEPIEVELNRVGHYRIIGDTQAAAEALLYDWPLVDARELNRAKIACLAVLQGENANANVARAAFIAAVQEANLRLRVWRRNKPKAKPPTDKSNALLISSIK